MAAKGPIRVFLVDDSPLSLVLLKRMVATSPDIVVVGTARNGREALAAFARAQPDVICTDYQMPEMDGLELIRHAMAIFPRPILVISSVIEPSQREQVFPLLAAGAVDVLAKANASDSFEQSAAALVQKIKLLSGVVVIARRLPPGSTSAPQTFETRQAMPRAGNSTSLGQPMGSMPPVLRPFQPGLIGVVAIGASTGGPQVLQSLFTNLPPLPCPILCVQHISAGFLEGMVDWLGEQCPARVKIAEHGELAAAGTIYFPPENAHLEIDERGRLIHSHTPPVGGHKPAVTTTFESVARSYRRGALGVLLTGMGSDGAAGLEAIMRAGGATIAQDAASCVVFGMPQQAIMRGAAHFVLPPEAIVEKIVRLTASVA